MKRNQVLFIYFIFASLMFSCKKKEATPEEKPTPTEKNKLEIQVFPYFGSEILKLDSNYLTPENFTIQFFDIKFYMAKFRNGGTNLAEIAFFDYITHANKFLLTEGDFTKFSQLQFLVGVDSVSNHADPSAFPNSNPLNILNAGEMHWDWNPGYIFLKVDAKIDTIPNDGILNQNHFISFHVGKDENSVPMNFSQVTWKKVNDYLHQANMKIDFKQFLIGPNPLDLKTEFKTHSEPGKEVLNQKVIQNFASAISFE